MAGRTVLLYRHMAACGLLEDLCTSAGRFGVPGHFGARPASSDAKNVRDVVKHYIEFCGFVMWVLMKCLRTFIEPSHRCKRYLHAIKLHKQHHIIWIVFLWNTVSMSFTCCWAFEEQSSNSHGCFIEPSNQQKHNLNPMNLSLTCLVICIQLLIEMQLDLCWHFVESYK